MITGIGVHFFGHGHPELIRASLEASTQDVAKHGNLQSNFEAYRFSELMVSLAKRNSRLSQCFVTTSGAVANESALKVCYQKHAPASRVIAFSHCFMGRTVTMAQLGDSAGGRDGIPLSTQVDYMPFWTEEERRQGRRRGPVHRAFLRAASGIHRPATPSSTPASSSNSSRARAASTSRRASTSSRSWTSAGRTTSRSGTTRSRASAGPARCSPTKHSTSATTSMSSVSAR